VPEARDDDHARDPRQFDAARVLLRPGSEGRASSPAAASARCSSSAGIRDILAKSLGTTNPINMLKATVNGLQSLRRPRTWPRSAARLSPRSAVQGARGRGAARLLRLRPQRLSPSPTPSPRRPSRRDKTLKITQTRSTIGQTEKHRGTLRALGLGKIGSLDGAQGEPGARRYAQKVRHLVRIEER
jgi:ribosomal protein L30